LARGVDPEAEASSIARGTPAWPSRASVRECASAADALVEDEITNGDVIRDDHPLLRDAQAVWAIIEHEEMHQETLAYMWHCLPYARKTQPAHYVTLPPRLSSAGPAPGRVSIPAATVTRGTTGDRSFAWDNERPAALVHVDAFSIDTLNVSNAEFMRFVDAGAYSQPEWWRDEDWAWIRDERIAHPPFWQREGGDWYWRAMFERVPLPLNWPVYVTWAEAHAYARTVPCSGHTGLPRAIAAASCSGSMPRAKIVSRCSSIPRPPRPFLISVLTAKAGRWPS